MEGPMSGYLDYSGRDDVLSGGVRKIGVDTPAGRFAVWVKRVGNHPDLRVLLLHGGPGATHEYFEACNSYLPAAGIEYYYDQLGSGFSDQPEERPGTPRTRGTSTCSTSSTTSITCCGCRSRSGPIRRCAPSPISTRRSTSPCRVPASLASAPTRAWPTGTGPPNWPRSTCRPWSSAPVTTPWTRPTWR